MLTASFLTLLGSTVKATMMILVHFQGTPVPSETPAELLSIMNETTAFYDENSYGQWTTAGILNPTDGADVFGWHQLDLTTGCNAGGNVAKDLLSGAARAAVEQNDGVDTSAYDLFVLVFDEDCPALNQGTGDESLAMAFNELAYTDAFLLAHEIGHVLPLGHSNFYDCGPVSVAPRTDCTIVQYRDIYTAMGFRPIGHFNAVHKDTLGWLGPNRIQEVTADGTFVLHPIPVSARRRESPFPRSPMDGKNDPHPSGAPSCP